MKRLAAIILLALPFPAMALEQSHICHEDSECIWVRGYNESDDLHPKKTVIGCVHQNTHLKENEWKLQNNFPVGKKCACDKKSHICAVQ